VRRADDQERTKVGTVIRSPLILIRKWSRRDTSAAHLNTRRCRVAATVPPLPGEAAQRECCRQRAWFEVDQQLQHRAGVGAEAVYEITLVNTSLSASVELGWV
jgi:hypothetical protein